MLPNFTREKLTLILFICFKAEKYLPFYFSSQLIHETTSQSVLIQEPLLIYRDALLLNAAIESQ